MADQAALLLLGAGHEAGHVDESHQWDLEGIAEADEARGLAGAINVQNTSQHLRLVRHNTHRRAFDAAKTADDVFGIVRRYFEEICLIHHLEDEFFHIIGLVGVGGHQGIEAGFLPVRIIEALPHRRPFAIGQRQEVDQAADLRQSLQVILERAVGDAGLHGVNAVAAQFLVGHLFVGHGLHHVRAGDVHVAGIFHHEDEVGDGGGVDVAACTGTHDHADLRNDT